MIQGISTLIKELLDGFSRVDKKGSGFLVLVLTLAFITAKCSSPPSPSSLPAVGGSDTANAQESGIEEGFVTSDDEYQAVPPLYVDSKRLDLQTVSLSVLNLMGKARAVVIFKTAYEKDPKNPDRWLGWYLNNYNKEFRSKPDTSTAESGKTFNSNRDHVFEVWAVSIAMKWEEEGKSVEDMEDILIDHSELKDAMVYPLATWAIEFPEKR